MATGAFAVRFREEGHEQDTFLKLFLNKNFEVGRSKYAFALAKKYIEERRVKEKYGEAATFEIIGTLGIHYSVRNNWSESKKAKSGIDSKPKQKPKKVWKFQKNKYHGDQGKLF